MRKSEDELCYIPFGNFAGIFKEALLKQWGEGLWEKVHPVDCIEMLRIS